MLCFIFSALSNMSSNNHRKKGCFWLLTRQGFFICCNSHFNVSSQCFIKMASICDGVTDLYRFFFSFYIYYSDRGKKKTVLGNRRLSSYTSSDHEWIIWFPFKVLPSENNNNDNISLVLWEKNYHYDVNFACFWGPERT